jgi:hypothetical protein
MIPLLPRKGEGRHVVVIVILGGLLMMAGQEVLRLRSLLAARPVVEDYKTDARTEDVRRGPVTRKRKTVIAPDGTKTTESELTIGAIDSHIEAKSESTHKETPVGGPLARAGRTRYVGLGIDPLRYAAMPRLRAGVTILGAFDVGVAYDSRFSPTNGAAGLELAYRF